MNEITCDKLTSCGLPVELCLSIAEVGCDPAVLILTSPLEPVVGAAVHAADTILAPIDDIKLAVEIGCM